jgi:UDP-2,4-diacetamido-2,4,6-trideoxy-beta-L-altropyranose hydrolase
MRVLFRADASVAIGSGHIVRCATMAQALVEGGHGVEFICRSLPGDLNGWLTARGFRVRRITATSNDDAVACRDAIGGHRFDWLVVDHYELAAEWEAAMAGAAQRIAAIDDFGRTHECDLLIDQNVANPLQRAYHLPARCERLFGPEFAILDPQFAALRSASLRRCRNAVRRALIFMSGSDPANETEKVLQGLTLLKARDLAIDVVIGASNPHRNSVAARCARIPNVKLHIQTQFMPELMAATDCAIGAGGNNTWERCALGLPALVTILADNQVMAAEALVSAGAHRLLGWHNTLTPADYADALVALDEPSLAALSTAAAGICDGGGLSRVIERLEAW